MSKAIRDALQDREIARFPDFCRAVLNELDAKDALLEALTLAEPVIAFSLSYYGSEDADEALQAVRDAIAKATA